MTEEATVSPEDPGDLLERYGIDPQRIGLALPTGRSLVELAPGISVRELAIKHLEAYEHAMKNRAVGNVSGFHVGAAVRMKSGVWRIATNLENSRDVTLCGERAAMASAWNASLATRSLAELEREQVREQVRSGLMVDIVVMARSADRPGREIFPCAECQSWFETDEFFSADTLVVGFRREDDGQLLLRAQRVRDVLPLHCSEIVPRPTDRSIASLELAISDKATAAMERKGVAIAQVQQLMVRAQQEHVVNPTVEYSHKQSAAAALMSTGAIFTGERFDWTARWFEAPDLTTAAHAVQRLKEEHDDVMLLAMGYFGNVQPPVESLGVLAQPTRAGPDTLIVTVEEQVLQIRTIQDYMTEIYISSSARHLLPEELR